MESHTQSAPHAPQPPEVLEGWYALHQVFAIERRALRGHDAAALHRARAHTAETLSAIANPPDGAGWSAVVKLVGSLADVLFVHLRPTLDELGDVQERVAHLELLDFLRPTFAFVSVTELGLYHLPSSSPADPRHDERVRAERESPHAQRRLYPELPANMPYVSFYPTSKRRDATQNWYTLSLEERCALMRSHGLTGRRHAGRVRQIITGAIGFHSWEWGVTLFADDPLELKRVVTDMRYDEASARYAAFGDFYLGRLVDPREWAMSVGC
jgi:hydrogen peroxide-dependent heme synthase